LRKGVPVMTGPRDPAAAGRGRLRAGHADREQVIETLKTAFVHGRLTKDELDARAGRALAARTHADLAALTADLPADPAAAESARPPAVARRWPLARAVGKSGICLIIAATAVRLAFLADPGPPGPTPYHSWAPLCLLIAFSAVLAALGFLGHGVVPAGPRTDQTPRAELRAHQSRRHRRHIPARVGRALRGTRPAPGTA
jgi:hypothetical protein